MLDDRLHVLSGTSVVCNSTGSTQQSKERVPQCTMAMESYAAMLEAASALSLELLGNSTKG